MCNKKYQKSAQSSYNTTEQTITTDSVTTINVLGTQCVDTGCSIDIVTNGFKILSTGLYRFEWDIILTPTATGDLIITTAKDGVTLPCTEVQDSGEADNITTEHIELILPVCVCACNQPVISAQITGIEGAVNRVYASAYRLA